MCLEFSKVTNPLLSRLYDEYSFNVIPGLGQVRAYFYTCYYTMLAIS